MNASTIVTIVSALLADGQTNEQIAATLVRMGFDSPADQPEALAPEAPAGNGHAPEAKRVFGGGTMPQVRYTLAPGITATRLAAMVNGRKLQVGRIILAHNRTGITKREILAAMQPATNGAAMSAIHGLTDRKIAISTPIAGASPTLPNVRKHAAVPPKRASKTAATVRRPLR